MITSSGTSLPSISFPAQCTCRLPD